MLPTHLEGTSEESHLDKVKRVVFVRQLLDYVSLAELDSCSVALVRWDVGGRKVCCIRFALGVQVRDLLFERSDCVSYGTPG